MTTSSIRQPAIFIPHGGGPCFFMDWTWGPADTWHKTQRFLEGLAATLPCTTQGDPGGERALGGGRLHGRRHG